MHVHLREPGQESSETIETGTRAAARGGFTAVCCMPNTKPVNDNACGDAVHSRSRESDRQRARVADWRGVGRQQRRKHRGNRGDEARRASWRCPTTGGQLRQRSLARQVMDYCRSLDLPVIEHSEDVSLAHGAVMREGVTSTRLGLRGNAGGGGIGLRRARRATCGTDAARDLHIAHLSARGSLELVRGAKQQAD